MTNPYRSRREIWRYNFDSADLIPNVTVIVGIYNSEPYLLNLFKQIESQTAEGIHWLFLENDSSDRSLELLKQRLSSTRLNATLVKNPINLGATGSIYTNIDLVETDWVTFFHQDDFYKPNCVEQLLSAALNSDENIIGVFGDAGRIASSGKKLGSFPSLAWFLPDNDAATYFLGLIREHFVPWPVIILKTQILRDSESPWHSASFPDTEITLKMLAHGKFLHLRKELMLYQENEVSESRSLENSERQFGAALALLRVFSSGEFKKLTNKISINDRSRFVEALQIALGIRLIDPILLGVCWATALETMDSVWNHQEPSVLRELIKVFNEAGGGQTISLLGRMKAFAGSEDESSPEFAQKHNKINLKNLISQRKLSLCKRVKNLAFYLIIYRFYSQFGGHTPQIVKKILFVPIIRINSFKNKKSRWYFHWR